MYYFRFEIPQNTDGTRVSYSPGWHGTIPKCPKDVTVLLYNDKEGYGIAQTEDTFVPPEVTKITEEEAKKILAEANDAEGVYFGEKLADRWLPEAINEDIEDTPESLAVESIAEKKVVADTFCKSCPICHKVVAYVVKYEDKTARIIQNGKVVIQGIIAKEIILTCPSGHRVKVVLNG